MKKGIILLGSFTLLLGLSSCSISYKTKDYSNKSTYEEFIKAKDKFYEIIADNDFIYEQNMQTISEYTITRGDRKIETSKSENNVTKTIKVDKETKIIQDVNTVSGFGKTEGIHGTNEDKISGGEDVQYQKIENKYYKLDKNKRGYETFYTFESLRSSYLTNFNFVLFSKYDEYYVDDNIYTAIDNNDDEKNTEKIQLILNNDNITILSITEKTEERELDSKRVKKENITTKSKVTYKIKDISIAEIDTKDYELY